MTETVLIAAAVRVLSQPLLDLYNTGKDRFDGTLDKWKNSAAKRALATKVASFQKVKTFWQRDKYVSLTSFYYPSRVCFDPGVMKNVASLRDLPKTGNLVIQGTIGQGKSIFLRYLCIQELKESGSGRIPVFLELRSLTSTGILKAIYAALDRIGFEVNDDLFDFYANSGKIVLLLDAFDEIEEGLIKQTITDLEALTEKYPNLQIIVTSRPESEIQNSRLFRVIQLAPLSASDHQAFFARIGIKKDGTDKLIKAVHSSSSEIASLLSTPLMLTLLTIVYQAESTIPNELPEFFDSLFQTLFTKHDKSKPGLIRTQKSGLGERKFQQLFQAFCFSTLQRSSRTVLSNEEFHTVFANALKHVESGCEPEGFKHDITKVVCLMQEEGYELHFIHKSVLEFYAASFVRNLNETSALKFYSQVAEKEELYHKWRQVLQFLSQIDKFRHAKHYGIPSSESALRQLGVQPPYTGPVNGATVLENAFNDAKLVFSPDGGSTYRQKLFGPYSGFPAIFQYMTSLTHHFMSQNAQDSFSEDELKAKYPGVLEKHRDYMGERNCLAVPWRTCISPLALKVAEAEAVARTNEEMVKLRVLKSYVSSEEKKVDLLDI